MSATTDILIRRFFREPVSTASHLAGLILAIVMLPFLLVAANGRLPHTIGALAFGGALILLYLASTLLHGVRGSATLLRRLEKFDHVAIFLLIVGTYVPVCLVTLHGRVGWSLLAGEITLAITGIVVAVRRRDTPGRHNVVHDGIRLSIYLIMGWMVVLGANALFRALPPTGLAWLVAGGIAYSLGAVVFATDRPHLLPGRFSAHDLWHFFVLAGSMFHMAFVLRYVLLPGHGQPA
ncbi:MAG: hemolysin III family protein [Capsulimonadales bacterium]|nr:hemolysin III family protein [Capsulimonadales bacterium]